MEILISLLAFSSVFLLVMGVRSAVQPRVARQRLHGLSADARVDRSADASRASLVRGGETGVLALFSRIGSRREVESGNPITDRLIHAGYRRPAAAAIYYGIRLTLAVALPLGAGLLPPVWALESGMQIALIGLLTSIGFVLPSAYLDRRVASRKKAVTRALPDALDLLVVCVEAGLGINQGLERVSHEFRVKSPILSRELALVGAETRAGKTTTEALRALADRTGVTDVSSLVALLVQTERFGTSVANALRVHAEAMRIKRMQAAEERAQLATLKLILPSTMIFGALLLVFLAPGMHNFFSAFAGIPE